MPTKVKLVLSGVFLLLLTSLLWWGVATVREKLSEREARLEAVKNQKIEEVKITLIEGWTIDDIGDYLAKEKAASKADFSTSLVTVDRSKYPFLDSVPGNASLEGYLFPDTYRITKDAPASTIISKMLENFGNRVPEYEALAPGGTIQGLTLHELVTLASIVERETGSARSAQSPAELLEERKIVAGIFYNRLGIGQALQSDATLNYITKSGRAQANEDDLRLDSPYNTYKYRGLPPGPISNPSLSSLIAAFNPTKTNYFYFLHSQSSGKAYYAETFEDHAQNKAKYLR